PSAVSRGLVQLHADTPEQVCASLSIAHLYPRLGHVTSLNAAHRAQHIHALKRESLMLEDDETRATPIDVTEQGTRTEVAIGHPEIMGLDRLTQRSKQRALLGM